jgi:DnaJ-class molecular chaperone
MSKSNETDPYIILGLPRTATFEQIRTKYKQLAKQHHPDKWSTIDSNSDEFRYHEEEFKKITVAYHLLEQGKINSDSMGCEDDKGGFYRTRSKEDWNDIWKKMEDLLKKKNILGHLSTLFKATVEEVGKSKISEHHFTVPVTLEEITARKKKKIRLFLKEDPEPFYVTIPCDQYPKYETAIVKKGITMQMVLHMKALPHELYEVDEIIEGELDLFHTLRMNLVDYFNGKTFQWKHLDGRMIEVDIPPLCGKSQGYLWKKMEHYGLLGKGSLFITLEWDLPSQKDWVKLKTLEQDNFLNALNKLHKNEEEGQTILE